ncbi:MAG: hypothetical protein E7294_10305 [Lachnospiraceae bacterium]|jgi:GH43 family beta-xylosidase|nr:hypothetical protein [Lachnospiraceae bacterium]
MRKQLKRTLLGLLGLAMAVTMMPQTALVTKADLTPGAQEVPKQITADRDSDNVLLQFSFDDETNGLKGGLAKGTNHGAKIANGFAYFEGNAYIEATKEDDSSLLAGKDEITISYLSKTQATAVASGWTFFAASSNAAQSYQAEHYLAVIDQPSSITIERYNGGARAATAVGNGTYKDWKNVVVTITEDNTVIYVDGVKKGEKSSPYKLSDILGNNGILQFGKANWGSGEFYRGYLDEVTIYDKVLTQDEITAEYEEKILNAVKNEVDLGDLSAVKENLSLPATVGDYSITWESSDTAVISNTGEVTRPEADKEVVLTATIAKGEKQITKEFKATVKALNAQVQFDEAMEALNVTATGMEDKIDLPKDLGFEGSSITWESSDPETVKTDGTVVRPAVGEADKKVTLTATVTYKDGGTDLSEVKTFEVVIRAQSYGSVIAYTRTDEANGLGKSLHLAYSKDGKEFTALNSNTGICFANNKGGSKNSNPKTIDAPYIFRKADGTYGMVSRSGSNAKTIYVWDSEDLINFKNERTIATSVAVKNGPSCEYNAAEDIYEIIWGGSDGKVYKTTTKNLKTAISTEETTEEVSYAKLDNAVLPKGASVTNLMGLSKVEFDRVVNKLDVVRNIALEEVKAETAVSSKIELPKTIKASYSDGSEKDVIVNWDMSSVDFDKAGTYEVKGKLKQTEYENPFIEQRADPCILKGNDGYYYFTASYPMLGGSDQNGYDKVVLRQSETLEGLADAEEITIFDCDNVAGENRYVWAPEIRLVDDNYYVFYTSSIDNSVWSIRPHVLKCTDPENIMDPDSWEPMGRMKAVQGDSTAFSGFSLDMTVFENEGSWYVIWAQTDGFSSLWIAEIDPEQPNQCISKCTKISVPEYAWERIVENVDEGPSIIKNGDKIYCAFSAAGTGVEYCIGLLSADKDDDLLDAKSWVKQGYPVLSSADVPGEYGPGHNSFTVDEDGNDIFVYHARGQECYEGKCAWHSAGSLYDPCRDARIKRVHWAADGSPILKMTYEEELMTTKVTATVVVKEKETPGPAPDDKPAPTPTPGDKPAPTPVQSVPDKVGTALTAADGTTYTVTNASAASPEVAYTKNPNKAAKKVAVPATLTVKGVTYKVTSIGKNAFKDNKKLKSVTIPEGVKTIGANAFKGAKNLKTIKIKSTVLKKVGKNAFKGIHAKATIKVPKKQKKAYGKILKKKGQASTVKIK